MTSALTFDSLLEAAHQCAKSVGWKDSVASWVHPRNLAANCLKLKRLLDADKYRLSGYTLFYVTEPKKRLIRSPKFRDRVVQRAMCNLEVYKDLTRGNIYDNGACQLGKGTSFAMDRLACHMQRYFRKHGAVGWVLRLDIRKFFDSIPHEPLKEMACRKIRNPEFARRVCEIIDSFDGSIGIGLGSQMSQLLAVSYLSGLDHYIKERLHIPYYVRYSDDIVIVHHDKGFLLGIWTDIRDRLLSLGLELNTKSTLHKLQDGIKFLKFKFIYTPTGRVIRMLDKGSTRRIRRRIVKMKSLGRTPSDLDTCFISWKAHASLGNSHRIIRSTDIWLRNLQS